MKFIVSGKNFTVTPALKDRAIKKLGKLDKFFNEDTEVHVTMSVEKNRHIVEVTIPFNGVMIRAEVMTDDMYPAFDKVIDILERQIKRYKTRIEKKIHETVPMPAYFRDISEEDEEEEFKVVRSKKFPVKPMSVDEAILQMNLLGHTFFVFSNGDTKQVNVVYKRKDGNYGLIEPEF